MIYEDTKSLEQAFVNLYESGNRLPERTYWNENKYLLPDGKSLRVLPASFIEALSDHISKALKNNYAEFAFYPDMGHVHILIPNNSQNDTELFTRNDLLFLYHTGELMKFKKGSLTGKELVEDDWLRWRYYSRNFIGHSGTEKELSVLFAKNQVYNTVRRIKDYQQVKTLYFSSSKNGCFTYDTGDKSFNFDISLRK